MARRKVLFLSTPSARRATLHGHEQRVGVVISIHALREEGDDVRQASPLTVCLFLSTPSARRATYCFFNKFFFKVISIHALREEGDNRQLLQTSSVFHYFYPRPPRGGRLLRAALLPPPQQISIHALREEGDLATFPPFPLTAYFYPRPPRGGRPAAAHVLSSSGIFLSTPSARRATCCGVGVNLAVEISIHALREEGDAVALAAAAKLVISIHALREEGDGRRCPWPSLERHFYPRPPRGGRLRSRPLRSSGFDFYPRPPRGGRRRVRRYG